MPKYQPAKKLGANRFTPHGNTRTAYWMFTDFDPSLNDRIDYTDDDFEPENPFPEADYVLMQIERCPTTSKLHYQGYVIIKSRPRFNALRTMYPKRIHWETRRGSHVQAKDYCSKEDTRVAGPWFFGTDESIAEQPGARCDITAFRDAILDGATMSELIESHPVQVARHPRFHDQVRNSMPQPVRPDLKVVVLWGAAGAGKTRYAYETYPGLYKMPIQQSSTLWFDGYSGQDTLLLDEFDGKMPLDTLLQLLDIYPTSLPVKGAFTPLTAKTIVITANSRWQDWYKWVNRGGDKPDRLEKKDALERRIYQVVEFKPRPEGHRKPQQFVFEDGVLVEVPEESAMDFSNPVVSQFY